MEAANFWLPFLLGLAVVLPLASFFAILVFGPRMGKAGESAGYLATGAIGFAAVLSFVSLFVFWMPNHPPGAGTEGGHASETHATADRLSVGGQDSSADESHETAAEGDGEHEQSHNGQSHNGHDAGHTVRVPPHYTGEFTVFGFGSPWVLGQFGDLRLSISYYIDSLTVCMFCMVTFIATLIHIYATGYMHDELHDFTDHEVTTADGEHLHRPGIGQR